MNPQDCFQLQTKYSTLKSRVFISRQRRRRRPELIIGANRGWSTSMGGLIESTAIDTHNSDQMSWGRGSKEGRGGFKHLKGNSINLLFKIKASTQVVILSSTELIQVWVEFVTCSWNIKKRLFCHRWITYCDYCGIITISIIKLDTFDAGVDWIRGPSSSVQPLDAFALEYKILFWRRKWR